METNPAKEPLNAFGLWGALIGAGLGVAIWYFALYKPDADDAGRFAVCFLLGIINGGLAGNHLGKVIRRK